MLNLDCNYLYILSVKNNAKYNFFAQLIQHISQKNTTKNIIVNHTALLFYHNDKWLIAETNFFQESTPFVFKAIDEYYAFKICTITNDIKNIIFNTYKYKHTQNKLLNILYITTSILFSYPYPLFNAIPSFEFKDRNKYKFLTYIIDAIITNIYKIQSFLTFKILKFKYIPFCTEGVINTILYLDKKIQNHDIIITDEFLNLMKLENFKSNEIYPQQIIETMPQIKVKKICL